MGGDHDVRRLALSALLLSFTGPHPPRWLLDALAEGLGGVVLFGSNVGDGRSVGRLTAQLRAAAGREVVIALDEEGGDVTRLDVTRGSVTPGAAALGHLDDEHATQNAYAAIGARLAEAGVTVNLAPVADVNSDARNPVIGVRSFGADPRVVSRHVAAAVRGLQSQAVAACVKHFPGHGATVADSHHEVATIVSPLETLEAVELPPFAAAVAAGARAVMTGHLLVPALDAVNLATVSPAINTGLLRHRLGFAGAIVTDALEMRALAATLGMSQGFVAAIAAGADTAEAGAQEHPGLVDEIPAAVLRALDGGALTVERLIDAAARTAALATVGAPGQVTLDPGLAQRCVEVLGALPPMDRPVVAESRPPDGVASGPLPWSLAGPLAERVPGVTAVEIRAADDAAIAVEAARGRTLVVVVRDPVRHGWQAPLLTAAAAHPAAVVVDVGWPAPLPPGPAVVRTRGVAPGLLVAVAELLAAKHLTPKMV